ncbi:hypothetical protein PN441_14830 [Spirulina major CS-329]|jgi:hypothetical protein|nr:MULTISPECIES: hypothetical protein [Spirulina]MDB9495709.1 hypothetical protein [Spirulina subsalsa CS-330]MDB9504350.1 hypothetical protein [Spirulina major CS-329]
MPKLDQASLLLSFYGGAVHGHDRAEPGHEELGSSQSPQATYEFCCFS